MKNTLAGTTVTKAARDIIENGYAVVKLDDLDAANLSTAVISVETFIALSPTPPSCGFTASGPCRERGRHGSADCATTEAPA